MQKPIKVTLPASKTFQHRKAIWTRYTKAGFKVSGVLQIEERRKPKGKPTIRRYAVHEEEPTDAGRKFKLSKPLGSKTTIYTEGPYFVDLSDTNHRCDCYAFADKQVCVHTAALLAIRERGGLPKPAPAKLPAGDDSEPVLNVLPCVSSPVLNPGRGEPAGRV